MCVSVCACVCVSVREGGRKLRVCEGGREGEKK